MSKEIRERFDQLLADAESDGNRDQVLTYALTAFGSIASLNAWNWCFTDDHTGPVFRREFDELVKWKAHTESCSSTHCICEKESA